jgi:hypothetical protein
LIQAPGAVIDSDLEIDAAATATPGLVDYPAHNPGAVALVADRVDDLEGEKVERAPRAFGLGDANGTDELAVALGHEEFSITQALLSPAVGHLRGARLGDQRGQGFDFVEAQGA